MQRCAVRIRHFISTSDDVQYKEVNHQVMYGTRSTAQKYFQMNKSLLLQIYQIKMDSYSSLWQAAKIN